MKLLTALREEAIKRLEKIEEVDIFVGVPSFNNEGTIQHVVETTGKGLAKYYKGARCLIMVSDGGSTDDTREMAMETEVPPYIEKLVTIYRGMPGKGSAVRAIFEAAHFLKAKTIILCDADVKSLTPNWMRNLAEPIIEKHFDYVAPFYVRYKYDATITNTIAYTLTRALYGKRIRQPIGGDFSFSPRLVSHYISEDVWDTDIAKFGIDIWLTITAIVGGFRLAQTRLGAKLHDVKDPAEHLGPMFREVVGTLFYLMGRHKEFWKRVKNSEPVKILGEEIPTKPAPFQVDQESLYEHFVAGLRIYGPLWKALLSPHDYAILEKLAQRSPENFEFPIELWVRIVYDFAIMYHQWTLPKKRLLDLMIPLYNARVAALFNVARDMNEEEFEEYIEQNARIFEENKSYLIERWEKLQ